MLLRVCVLSRVVQRLYRNVIVKRKTLWVYYSPYHIISIFPEYWITVIYVYQIKQWNGGWFSVAYWFAYPIQWRTVGPSWWSWWFVILGTICEIPNGFNNILTIFQEKKNKNVYIFLHPKNKIISLLQSTSG